MATPHHESHELRDTTAVAGAIVGATAGAVGGILGVAIGAVVGAGTGLAGGIALERENRRTSEHDDASTGEPQRSDAVVDVDALGAGFGDMR